MKTTEPQTGSDVALLELANLSKTFPGSKALDGAHLSLGHQEVHALIGTNGSGKSTLIKILAGYHRADDGSQGWFNGQELDLLSSAPRDRRMRFVHQDLGLIHELSVMDNLALGREYPTHFGAIDWKRQRASAMELLARFGVDIDVTRPIGEATPVERVIIAIAAALDDWESGPCLLVLDEPTAVLPAHEVDALFGIIDEVKMLGASVLYVSHRLDELSRIADRVTVFRGGRTIVSVDMGGLDIPTLATNMVGEEFESDVPERTPGPARDAPVALEGRNLSGRYLDKASFTLKKGEILGFAGLPGSGREELPYLAAGYGGLETCGELRRPADGETAWWRADGKAARRRLPLVPADRASEAVFAEWSLRENLVVRVLERLSVFGIIKRRRESRLSSDWIERFNVVASGIEQGITTLSGGNQQKIIIARAMSFDEPIIVLCEPTAGVDIGARASIYRLIVDEARRGRSVLVSSSDEGDLVALCDRIIVFRDGQAVTELEGADIVRSKLISAMEGA